MAQLNGYTNSVGDVVAIVPRPTDQYSPNGISRITPKASRSFAKIAYKAWVDGGMGVPWDGVYNDGVAQNLIYSDE